VSIRTRIDRKPTLVPENNEPLISVCPAGEAFPLPAADDYEKEIQRLKALVNTQRLLGREIVVVMGVGFVGAVMAGVVADSTDKETGKPRFQAQMCVDRRKRRVLCRRLAFFYLFSRSSGFYPRLFYQASSALGHQYSSWICHPLHPAPLRGRLRGSVL